MFIVVAGSGTSWPDVQVCGSGVALYVPGSGRVGSDLENWTRAGLCLELDACICPQIFLTTQER